MLKIFHLKRWRALSEYVDRRLSPESSGRLKRHLTRCSRCREAYEELQVAREALGALKVAVEQDSSLPTWSAIEARLRSRSLPSAFLLSARLRRVGRSFYRTLLLHPATRFLRVTLRDGRQALRIMYSLLRK